MSNPDGPMLEQIVTSDYAIPASVGGILLLTWRYLNRLVKEDSERQGAMVQKIALLEGRVDEGQAKMHEVKESLIRCETEHQSTQRELDGLRTRVRELESPRP